MVGGHRQVPWVLKGGGCQQEQQDHFSSKTCVNLQQRERGLNSELEGQPNRDLGAGVLWSKDNEVASLRGRLGSQLVR